MKLTDKKRKNIIDAALEEFQENGFADAKTTRIAKKAGVSSRTLYNHFESKEALFQAILDIVVQQKSTWEAKPFDALVDVEDQFVAILERYIDVVTEPQSLSIARMVNSEVLRDLNRAQAFYPKLAVYDFPIIKLIEEAMKVGALRKGDPEYASRQLFALVRGIFFWPELLLGHKEKTEGALKDCVKMFLSHYANEAN